jgi:arylsulfatase A-like enzyme
LLTGRNQHRVGFGLVAEFSGPFPGYNATIPRDCAPLPRILQENGYLTSCIGKWHLTPDDQQGSSGPFNRWPNGLGFDYYWGFLVGGAGQHDTLIWENQKVQGVGGGKDGKPYYFPDDWPRRRSTGSIAFAPRSRPRLGSCTSRPAAAIRHTTSRGSGWTNTRGSSTRAGTSCASARSRARRSSA